MPPSAINRYGHYIRSVNVWMWSKNEMISVDRRTIGLRDWQAHIKAHTPEKVLAGWDWHAARDNIYREKSHSCHAVALTDVLPMCDWKQKQRQTQTAWKGLRWKCEYKTNNILLGLLYTQSYVQADINLQTTKDQCFWPLCYQFTSVLQVSSQYFLNKTIKLTSESGAGGDP